MKLTQRVSALSESETLVVSQRAKKLQAEGIDVIDLSVGQPDFSTPEHICDAAKKAIDEGFTGYALPTAGKLIARQAVCEKFRRDNDLSYEPDQIIVTDGAKEAIYLGLLALVEPGDEVIIPAPYWVSYPQQVLLVGGTPIVVHGREENGYRITPEQLNAALTSRTRAVIMNSPNNPGGFQFTEAEQRALWEVLDGRDIVVLSDELYDQLTYDGNPHFSWAKISDACYSKCLTINAASKNYSMTGWRLGFAAGPVELIRAMAKLKSQTTSGTCHFNQYGLVAALTGEQSATRQMREIFEQRACAMYEAIREIRDVTCPPPTGAMFCFPNVSATYSRLGVSDSVAFAQKLLEQEHVAAVPGVAFGYDTHIRLSFAVSEERIRQAMQRFHRFVNAD